MTRTNRECITLFLLLLDCRLVCDERIGFGLLRTAYLGQLGFFYVAHPKSV